jgi:hypothetical protein
MKNIHLHIIGSNLFYDLLNELNLNYSISTDLNLKSPNKDHSVRIIFAEKLNLLELRKLFLENIPSLFLLKDKNFLKKNKLTLLDFHISLFMPIEILSFREILNILLTKYTFLKKSKIIINDYEIDSNQRVIFKNKISVKLTEKELELILALSKSNGLNKSFLLKNIWNHSSDLDSHAFETNLHRLRKKINKSFNDNKFIVENNSFYYLSK